MCTDGCSRCEWLAFIIAGCYKRTLRVDFQMFPFCASQDALGIISRTLQIIILRFIWEPSGIVYFSLIYIDFSVRTSVNANDLM